MNRRLPAAPVQDAVTQPTFDFECSKFLASFM